MRKGIIIGIAAALLISSGAAASGYLITRIGQIKPSVRASLTKNLFNRVYTTYGTFVTMQPNTAQGSIAYCPAGTVIESGGWDGGNNPPAAATVGYNKPQGSGWEVIMGDNGDASPVSFRAVANCVAPVGSKVHATRAQATTTNPVVARQVARMDAELRSKR